MEKTRDIKKGIIRLVSALFKYFGVYHLVSKNYLRTNHRFCDIIYNTHQLGRKIPNFESLDGLYNIILRDNGLQYDSMYITSFYVNYECLGVKNGRERDKMIELFSNILKKGLE